VQEIQGKGSYLDVHLKKQKKDFKKVILWSVHKLVDSTSVCLTENVKIKLYEEKLFLFELSKMNMKVVLFHTSDNVHSVQQKSSGLIFRTSCSVSQLRYSCHHNLSLLLSPYLCIRDISLSPIHFNQSRRVYINQRHQYICLI
jgi:hypothetical protein